MKPEIAIALELFDEADNLAKDWLIRSWNEKAENKGICRLYYQKAVKKRIEIEERINQLCNQTK